MCVQVVCLVFDPVSEFELARIQIHRLINDSHQFIRAAAQLCLPCFSKIAHRLVLWLRAVRRMPTAKLTYVRTKNLPAESADKLKNIRNIPLTEFNGIQLFVQSRRWGKHIPNWKPTVRFNSAMSVILYMKFHSFFLHMIIRR